MNNCDVCNKEFVNRSGLWKHRKKCVIKENDGLDEQNICKVIDKNPDEETKVSITNNIPMELILEVIKQSKEIQKLNGSALQTIHDLYTRGLKKGVFKKNLSPLEIHSAISALTFFNVSNQHTFSLIFKGKTPKGKAQTLKKSQVVDMMISYVCA